MPIDTRALDDDIEISPTNLAAIVLRGRKNLCRVRCGCAQHAHITLIALKYILEREHTWMSSASLSLMAFCQLYHTRLPGRPRGSPVQYQLARFPRHRVLYGRPSRSPWSPWQSNHFPGSQIVFLAIIHKPYYQKNSYLTKGSKLCILSLVRLVTDYF